MNVVERGALSQGFALYDEMTQAVDERTLEIIERRRKTAVVRRRGWLVRRALVFADVTGLLLAFIVAEIVVGPGENPNSWNEIEALICCRPPTTREARKSRTARVSGAENAARPSYVIALGLVLVRPPLPQR